MAFLSADKPKIPPAVIQPNTAAVQSQRQRLPSLIGMAGQSGQPLTRKASTQKSSLIGGS